jgi:hypothetical protein
MYTETRAYVQAPHSVQCSFRHDDGARTAVPFFNLSPDAHTHGFKYLLAQKLERFSKDLVRSVEVSADNTHTSRYIVT